MIGPDAFPEILTGQQIIHPDVARALPGGVSGSDAWLTHVWRASAVEGPEVRAFVAGFLTHAAGDVFAHTFVNSYSGGAFTFDPPMNAARHVVIEGYVAKRTPPEGQRLPVNTGGVQDFIAREMTLAKSGSLLQTHLLMGDGLMSIPFLFAGLRNDLQVGVAMPPSPEGFPSPEAAEAAGEARAWIVRIDQGLGAFPALSAQLARALLYPSGAIDMVGAQHAAAVYARAHLWAMVGASDQVVDMAYLPSDLAMAIIPEEVMEYAGLLATDPLKLILQQAYGLWGQEWVEREMNPERWIDRLVGPGTLAELNGQQLGIAGAGPDARWKIEDFPPAFDTVQLSKMTLLSDTGWRELAEVMAAKSAPMGVPPAGGNVMLGWIHSMDEGNAWRGLPGREGGPSPAPLFGANGAVYGKLFMPQRGAAPFR